MTRENTRLLFSLVTIASIAALRARPVALRVAMDEKRSRENDEERKKRQRSKFFPIPLDSEIAAEVGFRVSARFHKSNMKTFESVTFQRILFKKFENY